MSNVQLSAVIYTCISDKHGWPSIALPSPQAPNLSMEHDRMKDDNSSPDPTKKPDAPPIQADPLFLTPNGREFGPDHSVQSSSPSTASFQCSDKPRPSSLQPPHVKLTDPRDVHEPPRSRPLFRGFERPSFSRIAILTVLCLITYPAFYVLKFAAKDKSLFTVRLIVSIWCSGIGFALGYIILKIGAKHIEAASEFTLIWYRDSLRLGFKQPGPRWFT